MSEGEAAEDESPTSQKKKLGDNIRAGIEKSELNEPR